MEFALLLSALVICSLGVWCKLILMRTQVLSQDNSNLRREILQAAEEQRRLGDHVHWLCTQGGVSAQLAPVPPGDVFDRFTLYVRADRLLNIDKYRVAEVMREKLVEILDEESVEPVIHQPGCRGIYTTANPADARTRPVEI